MKGDKIKKVKRGPIEFKPEQQERMVKKAAQEAFKPRTYKQAERVLLEDLKRFRKQEGDKPYIPSYGMNILTKYGIRKEVAEEWAEKFCDAHFKGAMCTTDSVCGIKAIEKAKRVAKEKKHVLTPDLYQVFRKRLREVEEEKEACEKAAEILEQAEPVQHGEKKTPGYIVDGMKLKKSGFKFGESLIQYGRTFVEKSDFEMIKRHTGKAGELGEEIKKLKKAIEDTDASK